MKRAEARPKQTDFGRIYVSRPAETLHPKTTEQLARTLARLHRAGRPVRIRNAGHSVNGQTLTHGVQVNVSGITHVSFDERALEVTAGCGASWDEVLRAIGLPKFVPPVFPSNPGQRIHIGGSVSVGGLGFWSSTRGGLWNHVRRLTLVTMTGDVVECSPKRNPELFKFALCGYGRIGAVAELTIGVERAAEQFELAVALYHSPGNFLKDFRRAQTFSGIDLAVATEMLPGALRGVGIHERCLFLGTQVRSEKDSRRLRGLVAKLSPHDTVLYGSEYEHTLDFVPGERRFPLRDLVYWYPRPSREHQLLEHHPWGDYSVDPKRYADFTVELRRLTERYRMEPYMHKHAIWHRWFNVPLLGTYAIRVLSKNPERDFPLAPDRGFRSHYFGVAVESNVPRSKLREALRYVEAATNLAYSLGGRQYLYGYHKLSAQQVEQHFTRPVIERWQRVKDRLDPKHLLNIGVIEHLD